MAVINFANREITAKVVYFGASGAGSNTNVRELYTLTDSTDKSRLVHFGVEGHGHSWYFDYVPDEPAVTGFKIRYRVYSLPGDAKHAAHQSEVMSGVDGAVFVADARPGAQQPNIDRLLELERALTEQGLEMAAIPLVIQVNHTDHDDARNSKDVAFDLNPYGFPVYEAVAVQASGIRQTHQELTGALSARIRDNMAGNEAAITLTAVHRAGKEDAGEVLKGHLDALRQEGAVPESSLGETAELTEEQFITLPSGPLVEVPFQPDGFEGCKVVAALESRAEGGRGIVELILDRETGGHPRRVTVMLINEAVSQERLAPPNPSTTNHAPPDHITKNLPDVISLTPSPIIKASDLPGWTYGLMGIGGGILTGVLTGYLLFA